MSKVMLQKVVGNSFYTTGAFAVGVYRYGDNVILIDSGSDEQSASRIIEALSDQGCVVKAIINTHCHSDHCGGNWFFQKEYPGLSVYAAYDEKFFIEDPKWAPRCFCGNASPFAGLQNKYIAPQEPSIVTDIIPYQDHTLIIDGQKIDIVTLSGHTPGSIGIITPDNLLYSGDALFGISTLAKHPVLFYTDIEQTFVTFKKLKLLSVAACVLYHGGVIESLLEIVELHEQKVSEIKKIILSIVQGESLSLDLLTKELMLHYKIVGNLISFMLTQTTVRAYISLLEKDDLIKIFMQDGLLVFGATK